MSRAGHFLCEKTRPRRAARRYSSPRDVELLQHPLERSLLLTGGAERDPARAELRASSPFGIGSTSYMVAARGAVPGEAQGLPTVCGVEGVDKLVDDVA